MGILALLAACDGPEVPGIADALACASAPAIPASGDLARVDLEARCNDGSPAAAYVRPGVPEHDGDWVVVLEGGGYCDGADSCRDRWCGRGDYDSGKMSSVAWGDSRLGEGILSADHAFGGWNAVLLPYCTSDLWVGTRTRAVLGDERPYAIAFEGAAVLDAALEALEAGAGGLPPLGEARTVIFGGVSAGGYGVTHGLDRVAQRLAPVPVFGVIDALFAPEVEAFGEPTLEPALEEVIEGEYEQILEALWHARLDESCAASAGEAWRCADVPHVQRDELAAPVLLDRDLHDPGVKDGWAAAGVSQAEHDLAVEATLRGWAETADLSIRSTACGHHAHLASDPWFADVPVADAAGGPAFTLEQAVEALVRGERVVAIGAADGSTSGCPR